MTRNEFEAELAAVLPVIRGLAWRILRSRHGEEVDDFIQEALLHIWANRRKFSGKSSFATWVYRVAWNLALNRLRQFRLREERRAEVEIDDRGEWTASSWSRRAADGRGHRGRLEAEELRVALSRLPRGLCDAIVRTVIDGETNEEVARTVGVREGTIAWRCFDARRRLRVLLDSEE